MRNKPEYARKINIITHSRNFEILLYCKFKNKKFDLVESELFALYVVHIDVTNSACKFANCRIKDILAQLRWSNRLIVYRSSINRSGTYLCPEYERSTNDTYLIHLDSQVPLCCLKRQEREEKECGIRVGQTKEIWYQTIVDGE